MCRPTGEPGVLDAFRHYTRWHAHANRRRYRAPAAPWRSIEVDPADVERFTTVSLLWGLGRVRGGEWDRPANTRRLDDLRLVEGLRQRFHEDRAWEDTVYWERLEERFADGERVRGYDDIEALRERRLPGLDDLYASIREDGYRPNEGHLYDDPGEVEYVHELEPLVLLARDGEVLWTEGYHRLVLARLAGVDRIPVYVLRRHERWQRTRDGLAATVPDERPATLAAAADHPDAADMVDG
jgi:hypothetical protein